MKLQKVGLIAKSRRCFGTVIAAAVVMLLQQNASAVLLESWENDLDGWTVQNAAYTSFFSTKFGVTDQTYSLGLTGTAAPNYGQMILSAFEPSWTAILANSDTISFDIYTPAAAFGWFLQVDLDINNADTGFQSLGTPQYNYISPVIGSETTLTWTIDPAFKAMLATSASPTQLAIQIGGGYSDGNETMYLDNLRAGPEPSTVVLLGFGLLSLVCVARRRVS